MSNRPTGPLFLTALLLAGMSSAPVAVSGRPQVPTTSADTWPLPPTPWGDLDLQGIWSFATITPLERPVQHAGRELLTGEEVAALNHDAQTRYDRRDGLTPEADVEGAYNQFWWDRGTSTGRTSLIVDPPDGRVPPLTPAAQANVDAINAVRQRLPHGPEDRPSAERCLQYRPLPRLPTGYNNHHQIFQTPGYVVILTEMIHNIRVIPLDGRPPLEQSIRPWNGDSRGHWDGDTLVVETTNFSDKTDFMGSGANLHLVERFTRVNADTIDWRFTVDDPTTWERSWTAVLPFTKVPGPIFEYACHEGNYGLFNLLAAARAQEKAAEAANKR